MGVYLKKQAEFVVIGSGPGGATVARELTKAGKKVILLERGKDHRNQKHFGTPLGYMRYSQAMGFAKTQEGIRLTQGIMTGGSSILSCGCAAPPPEWLKKKYKINLDIWVQHTTTELNVSPLPRPLWGKATQRIEKAGLELGLNWETQPKFIDINKSEAFDCNANCTLGCRCRAKWTAGNYIDEALRGGLELITGATAKELLTKNNAVEGVLAAMTDGSGSLRIEAQTVILAAGAISSPVILQHSGISEAGQGLALNPTAIVYGECREDGTYLDPPMTISWYEPDQGYMLSPCIEPKFLYSKNLIIKNPLQSLRRFRYKNTMGIKIQLKDEISGSISMEGAISKPLTDQEQWRLNHAANLCRKILIQAGCTPDSIFISPLQSNSPHGSIRIGDLLSGNAETSIQRLYVSDASALPEAFEGPQTLTLIALAKYLAHELLNPGKPKKPATTTKKATKRKAAAKKTTKKKSVKTTKKKKAEASASKSQEALSEKPPED